MNAQTRQDFAAREAIAASKVGHKAMLAHHRRAGF